ncbi:MAG: hypothetical protein K6E12_00175 [Saccharofermentans sp.]|nr:hypothetical protein [Saccharofermentans sp.]
MSGLDSMSFKDMAKLKNVNEADELINSVKNPGNDHQIKNEFQAAKEVEEMKKQLEKQTYLLHAVWLLLKEKGMTNEELDKALNEAVLLEKRTDYKNLTACPNCGKGLQAMENRPFTSKCYYCGTEILDNPYKKYDGIDPYKIDYTPKTAEPEDYVPDDAADEQEIQDAQAVISQDFEPYDVSKDLNFDDET